MFLITPRLSLSLSLQVNTHGKREDGMKWCTSLASQFSSFEAFYVSTMIHTVENLMEHA